MRLSHRLRRRLPQSAQPMDGPARRLATHMMAEFFAAPLLDGKPSTPRPHGCAGRRDAAVDAPGGRGSCRSRPR
jgi:hypothetical protein